MLCLATKYLCQSLRLEIIKHLHLIYPPRLEVTPRLDFAPRLVPPQNEHNHSLLAIRMARENSVPEILPVAFYYAANILPHIYVDMKPSLSSEDQGRLIVGHQALSALAFKVAWQHILNWDLAQGGCEDGHCQTTRWNAIQYSMLNRGPQAAELFLNLMPHEEFADQVANAEEEPDRHELCRNCYEEWELAEMVAYDRAWAEVPACFGLDAWPEH